MIHMGVEDKHVDRIWSIIDHVFTTWPSFRKGNARVKKCHCHNNTLSQVIFLMLSKREGGDMALERAWLHINLRPTQIIRNGTLQQEPFRVGQNVNKCAN